jgi:hypothetical protein
MASQQERYRRTPIPENQRSIPHRPNLIQRISGLVMRRRPLATPRPLTAPMPVRNMISRVLRRTPREANVSETSLIQRQVSPEAPCPYDPNVYTSFPVFERRNCWNCGLPISWPRSREPLLSPCSACRSRSPLSHIAMNTRVARNGRATSIREAILSISEVSVEHPMRSSDEVPQALLERRPRRMIRTRFPPPPLFPNSRLPLPNMRPPARERPSPEPEGGPVGYRSDISQSDSKTPSPEPPKSPKLHHFHGLPNSKDYPYVHRYEVSQHLAAIRAGASSPVRDHQLEAEERARIVPNNPGLSDWSSTVYYARGRSPVPTRGSTPPEAQPTSHNTRRETPNPPDIHSQSRRPQLSGLLTNGVRYPPPLSLDAMDRLQTTEGSRTMSTQHNEASNIEFHLQQSRVYTLSSPDRSRHTPSPLRQEVTGSSSSSDDDEVSNFSTGTMPPTPAEINGVRTELRGGNDSPRLRGGGKAGDGCLDKTHCKGYTLNKRSFPCCSCGRIKVIKGIDDFPPRIVTSQRAVRAVNDAKRIQLPRPICKDYRKEYVRSYLDRSLVDTARPSHHSHTIAALSQNSPTHDEAVVPCLRGGGGPEWKEKDPIPAPLWLLTGGRGRPISVAEWNRQKPRKRMGGLLGMAVYGHKAGTPYRSQKEGDEKAQGDMPVLCKRKKVEFSLPSSASSLSSSTPSSSSTDNEQSTREAPIVPENPLSASASEIENIPKPNVSEHNPPTVDTPSTNTTSGLSQLPSQEDVPTTSTSSSQGTSGRGADSDMISNADTGPAANSSVDSEDSAHSATSDVRIPLDDAPEPITAHDSPHDSPHGDEFPSNTTTANAEDQHNATGTANETLIDNHTTNEHRKISEPNTSDANPTEDPANNTPRPNTPHKNPPTDPQHTITPPLPNPNTQSNSNSATPTPLTSSEAQSPPNRTQEPISNPNTPSTTAPTVENTSSIEVPKVLPPALANDSSAHAIRTRARKPRRRLGKKLPMTTTGGSVKESDRMVSGANGLGGDDVAGEGTRGGGVGDAGGNDANGELEVEDVTDIGGGGGKGG